MHAQNQYFHKVDYIVTDCPSWLPAFYEWHYKGFNLVQEASRNYTESIKKMGITIKDFILTRHYDYKQNGRYENEDEAKLIDSNLPIYAHNNSIKHTMLNKNATDQIWNIMDLANVKRK